MSSLWRWISGVFALLASSSLTAMVYMAKQRDKAERKARDAEQRAETTEASREQERRIEIARQQSRETAAEVQREQESRPATERPAGSFRR